MENKNDVGSVARSVNMHLVNLFMRTSRSVSRAGVSHGSSLNVISNLYLIIIISNPYLIVVSFTLHRQIDSSLTQLSTQRV